MALTKHQKDIISFICFSFSVIALSLSFIYGSFLPLPSLGKYPEVDFHIKLLFSLLIIEIFLMLFLLIKKRYISKFLFFVIFPYIISTILWFITNYLPSIELYSKLPTLTGQAGAIFITQYVIYGIWLIPVFSYISYLCVIQIKSE